MKLQAIVQSGFFKAFWGRHGCADALTLREARSNKKRLQASLQRQLYKPPLEKATKVGTRTSLAMQKGRET